ncbi:hypothetical protein ABZ917_37020 [Nonomuraea wenchangensis]
MLGAWAVPVGGRSTSARRRRSHSSSWPACCRRPRARGAAAIGPAHAGQVGVAGAVT